jgi:glycosyl transferase family 25
MIDINQNTPAFYINLDENIKRNKTILSTLNKYNFKNIVRVPGINTKTIEKVNEYISIIDKDAYDKLIQNNKMKQRSNHYELTNGSIGCYLSHINIYEHIVKNNIDYAIIFEDDCAINSDPKFFWEKIKSLKIPEDADIFLLNAVLLEEGLTDEISKVLFFLCLHSYIITNSGAKKILQNILPITMQIDSALSRLAYENKIMIYGLTKNELKIKQNDQGFTNIQTLGCNNCDIATEIYKYIDEINPKNYVKYYIIIVIIIIIGGIIYYK